MSLTTFALLVLGLVLLVVGAEALVRGASRLAALAGISPLVIGLTVVAFGTSSPELAVSVASSFSGKADLAIGNVVGSNIFNILLILGVSALLAPLLVAQQLIRIDVPIMMGVSLLMLLLGLDGRVGRLDGMLLFTGGIAYTLFLIVQSRREKNAQVASEYEKEFALKESPGLKGWAVNLALVAGGLALLVLGARWLVESATTIAKALGVSDLVIGLTIVAAGTSLPELATSAIASLRGERDIAVGNVVGSNIFNVLLVLGLSAIAAPGGIGVSQAALHLDIPVMIAVAVACLPIFWTGHVIARWEGALFVAYYLAYAAYLFLASSEHDALPLFSHVMLAFVIPLTFITLFVLAARSWRKQRG